MRTLVLIRHAHAEPHAAEDHARRLTSRGREEAGEVRRWLADQDLRPDRVLVSTAARAIETWQLAAVGSAEPSYEDRLYEATAADLRELLAETPPDCAALVLVGHNPSLEQLAWELDDSNVARDRTNRGLSPAGVAVFSLTAWTDTAGSLIAHRS